MITNNIEIKKFFLLFFPIFLILGSPSVNAILVLASIIVILYFLKNREFNLTKENWFIIFILFWLYLIVISFFSEDNYNSFRNAFSQIRFLFFSIFICVFFNIKENLSSLFKFWIIILILVSLDLYLQFFTGIDFFGYKAEGYGYADYSRRFLNPSIGRIGGPFGNELIAGSFISKLSPPIIFYLLLNTNKQNIKNNLLIYLFIIMLFLAVAMTGERLSLLIMISSIAIGLLIYKNWKFIIISLSIILFFFSLIINASEFLKIRFKQTIEIIKEIDESSYGRIYQSSFELWKKNPIIGVGLKNYHINCEKLADPNPESPHAYCSPSHSHNLFFQIISETGSIGLILFVLFIASLINYLIKEFKRNFNNINKELKSIYYGSFFLLVFSVIPIFPSGNFFTTWNGVFFWLHLGFCLSILKISRKKSQ